MSKKSPLTPPSLQHTLSQIAGIENASASHAERIASGVGGFIAILFVYGISQYFVDSTTAALLVASMGASAVLLFAVPHGPLSQPWSVVGGHVLSALIGVSCAKWIPNTTLAAASAVGLAIAVMYYLKCIHPPGGATALSAVVGGEAVYHLGYQFVLTPVLLNVGLIMTIAILYNALFPWRRYPSYLHKKMQPTPEQTSAATHATTDPYGAISHADFVYALSEIDSFVDVSEDDLLRIYAIATQQAQTRSFDVNQLYLGGYYSNNEYGDHWAVRQIIDESRHDDPEKDLLIYKVVAGEHYRQTATVSRQQFARWAKHQVKQENEQWEKI